MNDDKGRLDWTDPWEDLVEENPHWPTGEQRSHLADCVLELWEFLKWHFHLHWWKVEEAYEDAVSVAVEILLFVLVVREICRVVTNF